jgi:hypothetical protein
MIRENSLAAGGGGDFDLGGRFSSVLGSDW